MAKFKAYFAKLKEQGQITSAEYDAFLETLPDADIPDPLVALIEDKFYTLDRAAANPKVHGKIKAEALDPVDGFINELIEKGAKEFLEPMQVAMLKEDTTYKKLANLNRILPEVLNKVKKGTVTDEDVKKKLTTYEQTINEQAQRISDNEKNYNTALKKRDEDNAAKLDDVYLTTHLEKLAKKITLAEAYEETREDVDTLVLSKLRAANKLKLGENNGQKVVMVYDQDGKPKYNGNTLVTAESLLEEGYKPFVKKNATDPKQQRNNPIVVQPDPNKLEVRRGARTTVQ